MNDAMGSARKRNKVTFKLRLILSYFTNFTPQIYTITRNFVTSRYLTSSRYCLRSYMFRSWEMLYDELVKFITKFLLRCLITYSFSQHFSHFNFCQWWWAIFPLRNKVIISNIGVARRGPWSLPKCKKKKKLRRNF